MSIHVSEHIELINHTSYERVIYQQKARDLCMFGMDAAGEEPLSASALTATEPLLKLCSHFAIGELCPAEGLQARLTGTAFEAARQIRDVKACTLKAACNKVDASGNMEIDMMAYEDIKPPAVDMEVMATADRHSRHQSRCGSPLRQV